MNTLRERLCTLVPRTTAIIMTWRIVAMLPKILSHFHICQFIEEDISQAPAICLRQYWEPESSHMKGATPHLLTVMQHFPTHERVVNLVENSIWKSLGKRFKHLNAVIREWVSYFWQILRDLWNRLISFPSEMRLFFFWMRGNFVRTNLLFIIQTLV